MKIKVPPSTAKEPVLDEGLWREWLERGFARERRSKALALKLVELALVAGLIGVAVLWFQLAPLAGLHRS